MRKRFIIHTLIFSSLVLTACDLSFLFEVGDDIDTTGQGLSFSVSDNKTSYTTLDSYDSTNELHIIETLKNGTEKEIDKSKYTYIVRKDGSFKNVDTSKNFLEEGNYVVTVSYKSYEAQTVNITVTFQTPGANLVDYLPSKAKTQYSLGNELGMDDYLVALTYDDDTTISASINHLRDYDPSFSVVLWIDGVMNTDLTTSTYTFTEMHTYVIRTHYQTSSYKDIELDVRETTIIEKTDIKQTYTDFIKHSIYGKNKDITPLSGTPKLLIIPVWFTDSQYFISTSKKEDVRQDIQKAYLGTSEDTGWQSVSSYYYEESHGAVTLTGTVSEWYTSSHSANYYNDTSKTVEIVDEVTTWYFANHSDNKQNYDYDHNGFLDGIILVYAAANYITAGKTTNSAISDYASNGNLWAYCYSLGKYNSSPSDPKPNAFFWASYDFLYEQGSRATARTGYKYGYGSSYNGIKILDTSTFIHEMGHMFGALDYYDYSNNIVNNGYKPAGGFSMQDYNVGTHDPYSTMAYGWTDPYIPTESGIFEIGSFEKTGDVILLSANWNSTDSVFDEYLLLELYTPTGLNEIDSMTSGVYFSNMKVPGIRLWHVDARLANRLYVTSQSQVVAAFTDPSTAPCEHLALNSFMLDHNGQEIGTAFGRCSCINDDFKLLQLIRNRTSETIRSVTLTSQNDLFKAGSSFSISTFYKQFPFGSSGNFNNGLTCDWSFTVESITGSGRDAVARITITRG